MVIRNTFYSGRRILREVKKSGEIHIVLDCDVENVITVLREAKNVGMMTAYHNFLITSLDLHLVDMEEFKYGGTNITALRLVDPYRPAVQVGQYYFAGKNCNSMRCNKSFNHLSEVYCQASYDFANCNLRPV